MGFLLLRGSEQHAWQEGQRDLCPLFLLWICRHACLIDLRNCHSPGSPKLKWDFSITMMLALTIGVASTVTIPDHVFLVIPSPDVLCCICGGLLGLLLLPAVSSILRTDRGGMSLLVVLLPDQAS